MGKRLREEGAELNIYFEKEILPKIITFIDDWKRCDLLHNALSLVCDVINLPKDKISEILDKAFPVTGKCEESREFFDDLFNQCRSGEATLSSEFSGEKIGAYFVQEINFYLWAKYPEYMKVIDEKGLTHLISKDTSESASKVFKPSDGNGAATTPASAAENHGCGSGPIGSINKSQRGGVFNP